MNETDLELLGRYYRDRSEEAFGEIVRRHLNLVYSAALRRVRSPELAEEVSQSVFADLARQAPRLPPDTILPAWLYQVTHRTAIDVFRREARRHVREQIASEINAMNATASSWTLIEPVLDDAMQALDDTDRAAILLRYFENQSLREVGHTLGSSEEAAQKRVSRAVDRLREFLVKEGVAVGAISLAAILSAHAVQAAPVGLVLKISSTAALAGAALPAQTAVAATKIIAMTTLQKFKITVLAILGLALFPLIYWLGSKHGQNIKTEGASIQAPANAPSEPAQTGQALPPRNEVAQILPRDPTAATNLIDLSPWYNAGFTVNWERGGEPKNDLGGLPIGIQQFAGTEFDVRGLIQLRNSDGRASGYPRRVDNIPLNLRCRRLHFLHNTLFGRDVPPGETIGFYLVYYTDGEIATIPLKVGENILDWWLPPNKLPPGGPAVLGWEGTSEHSRKLGQRIYLVKFTWENPRPDVELQTLHFVSEGKKAGPFLVAVTADNESK